MGKKKTNGDSGERESEAIDREMDEAAGPLDGEDEAEEAIDVTPAVTPEEEQLAARVLETLRTSEKALTVAELHPEQNVEGEPGYVASGQVEKAALLLVERGVAQREGEAFVAVRPGVLARRRAELLQMFVELSFSEAEWADADRAASTGVDKDPTKRADATALVAAGLLAAPDANADYYSAGEKAEEVVLRGALTLVEETMAECRESGAAVITDGDVGAELAKERTSRQGFESMYEGALLDRALAQQAAERARADIETLRTWFTTNNLPCPLDKPEIPKPPRDEFSHSVHVDAVARGKMYGIRIGLQRRQGDIDAVFATAKAQHKAHSELVTAKLKSLDEAAEGMWYDAQVFRRTDVRRGVAEIVSVDDESWILATIPLRSEEVGGEPAKAEPETPPLPAPTPAPEAAPADPGAMTIIPADQHGTLAAAVASPAFAEKLAAATGQKVTVDASGPVPVVTVSDQPKRDLVLDKKHVADAIVEYVATLKEDEAQSAHVVTNALASIFGVPDASIQSLGMLVKAAAKSAHQKGLIRWELSEGVEWIGRPREKKANGGAASAEEADAPARALAKIRAAGPEGLRRSELTEDEEAAVDTLIERAAVKKNGKKGLGARLVAGEHAPANGAEVSA